MIQQEDRHEVLKQCKCARAYQVSSPKLQKRGKKDTWLAQWASRILSNNTVLIKVENFESFSLNHLQNTVFAVILNIKAGKRRRKQTNKTKKKDLLNCSTKYLIAPRLLFLLIMASVFRGCPISPHPVNMSEARQMVQVISGQYKLVL